VTAISSINQESANLAQRRYKGKSMGIAWVWLAPSWKQLKMQNFRTAVCVIRRFTPLDFA
jgi:hypothetical protein